MSFYGLFKGKGPSGFGYNSTSAEVCEGLDLSGKTYVVTGCNSGLGEETMRVLLDRGAKVFALARTEEKAAAAAAQFSGETVPVACELSEPDSVRAAVKTITEEGSAIDGIIANAGIMALPKRTVHHGLEMQFLTNHIGHFILVTGLVDRLSDDGRVVMLSSGAHSATYKEGIRFDDLDAAGGYTAIGAYGQSKLSNHLFAKHLATRLPKPNQRANSVHPGVIATNLGRHMPSAFMVLFKTVGSVMALKSVPQGAATQLYVATHPEAHQYNGLYFADCNPKTPSDFAQDEQLAAQLWEKTESLVAAL